MHKMHFKNICPWSIITYNEGLVILLAQEGDAGQAPVLRTDGNDNVWQNKEAYLAMFERGRGQSNELA